MREWVRAMKWYAEYMQSHQTYENKLCHFIGFLGIVGTLMFAWQWVWVAILFDLAISGFGHRLEGGKPYFMGGRPHYAIAGYILMNLQFFWFNKIALTLGFGIGFFIGRLT